MPIGAAAKTGSLTHSWATWCVGLASWLVAGLARSLAPFLPFLQKTQGPAADLETTISAAISTGPPVLLLSGPAYWLRSWRESCSDTKVQTKAITNRESNPITSCFFPVSISPSV